jgi:uncharacterized membrane protein YraQ (UPF0718 family)
MAFGMFWEIFWALALGFFISAVMQAVVSKKEMSRLLPDDSLLSILKALGLGAASSSCSYAAVAIARSAFRKGANFTAAIAFEVASTNLVADLGIVMAVVLGWQFTLAEFIGAPVMVFLLRFLFRRFLSQELVSEAKRQADRGLAGLMEGHAEMDMAVRHGPIVRRMLSDKGRTAISHYYVMDWVSVWKDVTAGVLVAGILAASVPPAFWNVFFQIPGLRNCGAQSSVPSLRCYPSCVPSGTFHLRQFSGMAAAASVVLSRLFFRTFLCSR